MEEIITVNNEMHFLGEEWLSCNKVHLVYIISTKDCLQVFSGMLIVQDGNNIVLTVEGT